MNQLGSNFAVPSATTKPSSAKQQQEGKWFRSNDLLLPESKDEESPDANGRLYQGDKGIQQEALDSLQNSNAPTFKAEEQKNNFGGPQQEKEPDCRCKD